MFDLLITGGDVLDGTGAPSRFSDVAIVGDRIAAVGDLAGAEARQVLSLRPPPEERSGTPPQVGARAETPLVCPGFIDAHTHSDAYLLIEPSAASKIWQGVTTEVVGNCGASCAPLAGDYRMPSDWAAHAYPGAWRTLAEYRRLLDTVGPAVNVRFLVGHNTLRGGVVGYANRPARPEERASMARLLERSMDEGACGLSTGLVYAPGCFSDAGEVSALAAVVARRGGVYASHMRSEGTRLLEALDEVLGVARATGVRAQVSHLKASGRANWDKLPRALDRIRAARAAGLDIAADRYPYTSSCTDLDILFPAWAAEGGRAAVLARLDDPVARRRLRDELDAARGEAYWPTVTIGSTVHPANGGFMGRPLTDVAASLGLSPADAVLHLCRTDELRTTAFFDSMSEDNLVRVLGEPYVMPGSDASVRAPWGPLSADHPHPRAYGTFARYLRMAIDGRTVPLPEAVRRMTTLPARQFGLVGRGELRVGQAADIVVLDPGRVRDTATFARPHQLAEGIRHVIVNGVLTLSDGVLTGVRGGRFLPLD